MHARTLNLKGDLGWLLDLALHFSPYLPGIDSTKLNT